MNNKKDKLEDFKAAISSTVRSLSNSPKTIVSFGNQVSDTDKSSIKLPNLEYFNDKVNFEEVRAIADSKSLILRFSDKRILDKFRPNGVIS